MWTIDDISLERSEKKQIFLIPNELEECNMPTTLICGKQEGPTVCMTAGMHSGEHVGVAATIKLAKEINPENLRGQIIIIHCENASGFLQGTMDVVPDDGVNLNNQFPGKQDGTTGEKIQYYLASKIFSNIDFLLDLHGGSKIEKLKPCLFYTDAVEKGVVQKSIDAAFAMDIPVVVSCSSLYSQFSYVASTGVPSLLLERGGFGECEKEDVLSYINDLRLFLKHMDMYDYVSETTPCDKKIYNRNVYLSAEEDGLWYPELCAGDKVSKGDFLGQIEDFFGNVKNKYYAKQNGIIFYYTGELSVKEGMFLIAYGEAE